jgi:short-subunit dehydrogenase
MSLQPARPLEHHPKAIVVGASVGIGAALVHELAHAGYSVAALARRESELQQLAATINTAVSGPNRVLTYSHDVTDFAAIPALFQTITADLGGLDLIIYNAGAMPAMAADEYSFAKDKQMIDVNLLGAMAWLSQAAVRFSRAQKGQIVGISSIAGDRGRRQNPGYNVSKAAFTTYLEALRNRLSQHGVTVTTIKPGFIQTAMLDNAPRVFWVISAQEAARQIMRAIRHKRQSVYIPWRWGLVSRIIQMIPSFIFRRLNV